MIYHLPNFDYLLLGNMFAETDNMTSIDSAVSGENAYFLLDLKLPDLLKDVSSDQPGNQSSSSGTLIKFGFLALLEQISNSSNKGSTSFLDLLGII